MNDLGEFLKARRSLLRPEDVGLPAIGRRRVAGLRRDELARLAGVSEHYLVRLEQGRDRNPSPQVLTALAAALRLDEGTTAHLHTLAAGPRPSTVDEPLAPGVRQLLDAWTGVPAYVRNRRLDVLAGNALAVALSPMYEQGRNLAREIFLSPPVRALLPDWDDLAAGTVAALRAGADPRDPGVVALVAEVAAASGTFRRLWDRHDARPTGQDVKRFAHPVVGPLTLHRHALEVAGTGQLVVAYQAEPGSGSAARLALLVP
ncbi:helix-turn-helix transcriptional regulator [Dactylosporangium sp. NBC_01737]|uniref:helix-turn-helix domain-containing protein n=1 Tax=Dactylosporangium sp. NBC_01737 TaxID=2975959 RepID=UPI002E0E391D|nr:helix-turn-helix transcriptional regulator [Dactylosporangium sp. NBC_01737]